MSKDKYPGMISKAIVCIIMILQIFSNRGSLKIGEYLTIRPVARKGYGLIAHEAMPNGLFTRGP